MSLTRLDNNASQSLYLFPIKKNFRPNYGSQERNCLWRPAHTAQVKFGQVEVLTDICFIIPKTKTPTEPLIVVVDFNAGFDSIAIIRLPCSPVFVASFPPLSVSPAECSIWHSNATDPGSITSGQVRNKVVFLAVGDRGKMSPGDGGVRKAVCRGYPLTDPVCLSPSGRSGHIFVASAVGWI